MADMPAKFTIIWEDGRYFVSVPGFKGGVVYSADLVEQMAAALRIIAGREQCIDNLMSKADVANAALQAYEAAIRLAAQAMQMEARK